MPEAIICTLLSLVPIIWCDLHQIHQLYKGAVRRTVTVWWGIRTVVAIPVAIVTAALVGNFEESRDDTHPEALIVVLMTHGIILLSLLLERRFLMPDEWKGYADRIIPFLLFTITVFSLPYLLSFFG